MTARRERQLRDELELDGWVTIRAAGSLGPVDVAALRRGDDPRLVQVKTDRRRPFDHFTPRERADLSAIATRAGAEAWLLWWPPRAVPRWIPEQDWPR